MTHKTYWRTTAKRCKWCILITSNANFPLNWTSLPRLYKLRDGKVKEWETITSHFAMSCVFQVKLNSSSLYLAQYLLRETVWIYLSAEANSLWVPDLPFSHPSAQWLGFLPLWMLEQDHAASVAQQPRWDLLTQVTLHHMPVVDEQFKCSMNYFSSWDLEWLTLHKTACGNIQE